MRKITPAAIAGLSVLTLSLPRMWGEARLVSDEPIIYDHEARALVARGRARLTYEGSLLSANEILFSQANRSATARGDLTLTHPSLRVVGEEATYHVDSRTIRGKDLRFGRPPFYAHATAIEGGEERVEMENATVFVGEPRPAAFNVRARRITYVTDEKVQGEDVTLRIGRVPVFYLPSFSRRIDGLATEIQADAGYTGNLGGFGFVATRTPLFTGFSAGPEFGVYGQRGFLIGPGFSYRRDTGEHWFDGNFTSGYIHDRGDPGIDRLGRPIDDDRHFAEWRHKQRAGENIEITAQANLWSDSEITRDFRPRLFRDNQFPDNYFEAVYLGGDYLVSAFTRADPNDFQVVQERLPEVRFDLLPKRAGDYLYHQFQASAAVLREDRPLLEDVRSDRLDFYYGLHWPIAATEWLTITPKAGARLTHYQRALAERDDYTRALGEIGFDAEMNAYSVYDYNNELWRIDGIRHVVKPRIQYRYIPEADRGARFIPQVDREPFTTQLQPIDLGQIRHLDELQEIHTFRYGIDNVIQTRHADYGSRDLLSLFVANDLRISRQPGQEFVSDVHTQFAFTPVYWLRFDALQRLSPQEPDVRELATGLTLTDARIWSLRFGTEYLQGVIEQYAVFYSLRLNENYSVTADLRYDALLDVFSRQGYSLVQNLYRTWEVRYQVYFTAGAERESATGFGLSFTYLSY